MKKKVTSEDIKNYLKQVPRTVLQKFVDEAYKKEVSEDSVVRKIIKDLYGEWKHDNVWFVGSFISKEILYRDSNVSRLAGIN